LVIEKLADKKSSYSNGLKLKFVCCLWFPTSNLYYSLLRSCLRDSPSLQVHLTLELLVDGCQPLSFRHTG